MAEILITSASAEAVNYAGEHKLQHCRQQLCQSGIHNIHKYKAIL